MLYLGLGLVIISLLLMFIDWVSKHTSKGKEKEKKYTELFGREIKEWNWSYDANTQCLNVEGKVIPLSEIESCFDNVGYIECYNGDKYRLCAPLKPKQNERQKLFQQVKAQGEKKEKKDFETMQKSILEFAKQNGKNLDNLYRERDLYLNKAVRELTTSKAPVYEPNYTRGAVQGSLADSISVLSNAQKKKDFDNSGIAQAKENAQKEFPKLREEYKKRAEEIIAKLEKIPNSEQYVAFEKSNFSSNMSYLNKE